MLSPLLYLHKLLSHYKLINPDFLYNYMGAWSEKEEGQTFPSQLFFIIQNFMVLLIVIYLGSLSVV